MTHIVLDSVLQQGFFVVAGADYAGLILDATYGLCAPVAPYPPFVGAPLFASTTQVVRIALGAKGLCVELQIWRILLRG